VIEGWEVAPHTLAGHLRGLALDARATAPAASTATAGETIGNEAWGPPSRLLASPNTAYAAMPPERPAPGPQQNASVRRLSVLSEALGCSSYLEIGVSEGGTLMALEIPERVGVDPAFKFNWQQYDGRDGMELHACNSDEFFASLPRERRFDLIFVDGLHAYEQTYRDILNALRHSHDRTVILIDDTIPSDVFSTLRSQQACIEARKMCTGVVDANWHGDTFKVLPLLTVFHPDLRLVSLGDGGNPQTLLWRPPLPQPEDPLRTLQAMAGLENLAAVDFLWLLNNLELWNVVPEAAGLETVLADLCSGRRAA
jgi:predicted O-methyltransferase YrrM